MMARRGGAGGADRGQVRARRGAVECCAHMFWFVAAKPEEKEWRTMRRRAPSVRERNCPLAGLAFGVGKSPFSPFSG